MYRIIYSLQVDLPALPASEQRQLIILLQWDGSAKHVKPVDQRTRAIELWLASVRIDGLLLTGGLNAPGQ